MLAGKIKDCDNIYYLYVNDCSNHKEIDVVKIGSNGIIHLNKNEIISLFCNTFASDCIFKEKTDDYYIYLDEAGNKRYFKDDKEDYVMFFKNNGYNAILYKDLKDFDNDILNNEVKSFELRRSKRVTKVLITMIALNMLIEGALIYTIYKNKKDDKKYYKYTTPITIESMSNFVESSNLRNDEKQFLDNKSLFEDILSCVYENKYDYNDNGFMLRNYELSEKLNEINIKTFGSTHDFAGYYSAVDPNTIYIHTDIPSNEDIYFNVLSHEYIHLLQNENMYQYICEASAEIISSEYLNTPLDSYNGNVIRLKVLMEIIGPQVVFNYNFKGNDTSFDNELKKYLSEEEYKELIGLFKTDYKSWTYNEKEINDRIDNLLAKLYFNKTGEDIKNNQMISYIYNNDISKTSDRLYFNKHNELYFKDFSLGEDEEYISVIKLSDAVSRDMVDKYCYYNYYRYSENDSYQPRENENIIYDRIIYEPVEGVSIISNSPNRYLFSKNGIIYDENSALDNSILIRKKENFIYEENNAFDINKAITSSYIEVYLNDGTILHCKYSSETKEVETLYRYKIHKHFYPSINTLFPVGPNEVKSTSGNINSFSDYISNQKRRKLKEE